MKIQLTLVLAAFFLLPLAAQTEWAAPGHHWWYHETTDSGGGFTFDYVHVGQATFAGENCDAIEGPWTIHYSYEESSH